MGKLLNTQYVEAIEAFHIITGNPIPSDPEWPTNGWRYTVWLQTHLKWFKRSRKIEKYWRYNRHLNKEFHKLLYEHGRKRLK